MERRKLLVGLGSIAAGGAAAMGTGAFSFIAASRPMNVNIANDPNAYLGLEPTSPYAQLAGNGELLIDLTNNGEGNGLNNDANTFINDVFRVENQGSDPIKLSITPSGVPSPYDWPFLLYHSDESRGSQGDYIDLNIFTSLPAHPYSTESWWNYNIGNQDIHLEVGEDAYVHLEAFLSDSSSIPSQWNQTESGFPDEIPLYADASTYTGTGDYS